MHVAAVQCRVQMDVGANLRDLESALDALPPETLVVAPEGLLSGYLPEPGFVVHLDEATIAQAIERAQGLAMRRRIHLIAGACVRVGASWHNSSFYFGPNGQSWRYDKVNLATSERPDFTPGNSLPTFDVVVDGHPVRLAVQMCREIRYPEQWRWLATQGAQIIAYVNNAIGGAHGPELWRAHVISRAAETERFIVGANHAADNQICPTLIVAPTGKVLAEASVGKITTITARADLSQVSDWVISQARGDIIAVEASGR